MFLEILCKKGCYETKKEILKDKQKYNNDDIKFNGCL